ncbi:hypothetical protein MPER_09767 [Moniliophthora perniciosa FA553]|nr:hypothetical protein MPER_09767 [Moniliophthora perniciosa FA553]
MSDTSLRPTPQTLTTLSPASTSVRNERGVPRSEIVGGILISPSEAVKWISKLCDMVLTDDGSHDLTALLHLKSFGKRMHVDICLVAQSEIYTPDGTFLRQPFMIITQKSAGAFFKRSDNSSEEVVEDEIKMIPGTVEEEVQKYLKAQGVEDMGFKTFFYQ